MKFYKFFTLFFLGIAGVHFAGAQTSINDSIFVNGNCGMCKKTIEKSALAAGATTALWDRKAKVLNVQFDSTKTNNVLIQKSVAKAGYDTENFKATDEAYLKLEDCCQYDRKPLKKTDKK